MMYGDEQDQDEDEGSDSDEDEQVPAAVVKALKKNLSQAEINKNKNSV